jgi:aminoglycoside phosphotransferase (APT) family kinase protein
LTAFEQATPSDIATCLNHYLQRKAVPAQVMHCELISGGFENVIARVWLDAGSALRRRARRLPSDVPLILRLCRRADAPSSIAWQARVHAATRRSGIAAPAVLLAASDAAELGGAFLLLEQLPGRRLDFVLAESGPVATLRLTRAVAAQQAAIFRVAWRPRSLPNQFGLPGALGGFNSMQTWLNAAELEIHSRRLSCIRPLLDWLRRSGNLLGRHRPVFLHGDFHPRNLLSDGSRITGVLDWTAAGFGDPHEDIGWTGCVLATVSSAYQLYMSCINSVHPVDRDSLRYCEVWAAVRWLLLFLPSFLPDAGAPALSEAADEFATAAYFTRVLAFAAERTGVSVVLPEADPRT